MRSLCLGDPTIQNSGNPSFVSISFPYVPFIVVSCRVSTSLAEFLWFTILGWQKSKAGETQDSRQTLLATKHAHWTALALYTLYKQLHLMAEPWQNSENMRKLIFDDLHVFVHRDNFLSAMYLRPGSFKGLYRSLLLRIEPASISAREWRCWYLRLQARAFQAKPNVAKQDVKAGRYISGKGKLCWNIQTVFLVWEHCYSNARNLSLYSRNMQACACQWF